MSSIDDIALLHFAQAMARHASARQTLVARNVANADTPGYKARDLAPFHDLVEEAGGMRRTRPGHILGAAAPGAPRPREPLAAGAASPNGNTVSLEDQMVRGAQARLQYDQALAVYRKSLDLMRMAIGRGR